MRAAFFLIWLFPVLSANLAAQEAPAPPAPATAESYLRAGTEAVRQGKYDEAVHDFRTALRLDPGLGVRARYPLAAALLKMNDSAAARQELEALRRQVGDQPEISYFLGMVDMVDGNFESAVRNLTEAMAKPPYPDTAYQLGKACLRKGDLIGAEKWLTMASDANPHDPLAPYELGLAYRRLGREQDAKNAFALSSQRRQQANVEGQARLVCSQKLAQGLRDEARQACAKLYDPNDAETLTALGRLYGRYGDFEAALQPLQRAAELAPDQPETQYNLAFAYFQLDRLQEARKVIAAAVERWPDEFLLNGLFGAVASKLGENSDAYRILRHAHDLKPQDAQVTDLLFNATVALARTAMAARQYPDARRYFEEAAKLQPDNPTPLRGEVEIDQLAGKPQAATAH